eukprot:1179208-Prorocentrum_minimum.AAC.1
MFRECACVLPQLLQKDAVKRMNVDDALQHPWLTSEIGSDAHSASSLQTVSCIKKTRKSKSFEMHRNSTDRIESAAATVSFWEQIELRFSPDFLSSKFLECALNVP